MSPNTLTMIAKTIEVDNCADFAMEQQQYINHVDVQVPDQIDVYIPEHWNQLPKIETYDTDWNFLVELNSESAGRASWMFSPKLNKVFVKINTDLSVYVNYNNKTNEDLFIRAMIVYTSPNDLAEPVKKCPNHREKSGPNYAEHILTCSVPETMYHGCDTGKLFKDKLALLVPLTSVIQGEPLKFQFSCQNSCSGGMNRKMTSIIFTLENCTGDIYGRTTMSFKVCSCPKRDKEKEEKDSEKDGGITKVLPKKRKLETIAPSTSKKVAMTIAMPLTFVKQESDSTISMDSDPMLPTTPKDFHAIISEQSDVKREQNCIVPTFSMPSPELKQLVLTTAFNAVAGELARTGDAATYQPYLNDLQQKIGK